MADPDEIDEFFDGLEETIRWVASTSAYQKFTGATPEEVDLAVDLGRLARLIPDHNKRLLTGEPVDWAELACELEQAAYQCYRLVIIDPSGDARSGNP